MYRFKFCGGDWRFCDGLCSVCGVGTTYATEKTESPQVDYASLKYLYGKLEERDETRWRDAVTDPPAEYVSVQGHIATETDFPSVRECFRVGNEYYFPALRVEQPVDKWKPFSDPPEKSEKCGCYHIVHGKNVCYGTKECEECVCGGDRKNCDFY